MDRAVGDDFVDTVARAAQREAEVVSHAQQLPKVHPCPPTITAPQHPPYLSTFPRQHTHSSPITYTQITPWYFPWHRVPSARRLHPLLSNDCINQPPWQQYLCSYCLN